MQPIFIFLLKSNHFSLLEQNDNLEIKKNSKNKKGKKNTKIVVLNLLEMENGNEWDII